MGQTWADLTLSAPPRETPDAGKAKAFIPTKSGEFRKLNLLLEGVVWGW